MQIVDVESVTEPVTLGEVKSFSRIDADYASDDNDLAMAMITARKRIEAYLNIGLVQRDVTVYWDGSVLELPLSPNGDIVSIHKNNDADPLTTDDYHIDTYPAKTISINGVCGGNIENVFYAIDGSYVDFSMSGARPNGDVYKCIYQTGYETLPNDLKFALLNEIDALYKLRGEPITDEINPNTVRMVSHYSRNLIL